jgi:hypothetical protein
MTQTAVTRNVSLTDWTLRGTRWAARGTHPPSPPVDYEKANDRGLVACYMLGHH